MKKNMPKIIAIAFIAWILLLATDTIAQYTKHTKHCAGITKKKQPCKRLIADSLTYCFQHLNQK